MNTATLVRDIVEMLAPPAGFTITTLDAMPVFNAERVPLEMALRNLIGNAVKHHHAPATGQVTVNARHAGDWIEFAVADNGPGIEPIYHQRIFEMFSTLQSRDKVEGSGMGLSVVQKTVETRGGRVWVDSDLGRGATFYFTWPAPQQAAAAPVAAAGPSVMERLKQLNELKGAGLLTEDEFSAKKAELMKLL